MKIINIYRTIIAWIVFLLVILNIAIFQSEQVRWFAYGIDFMIISECIVELVYILRNRK